MTPRFAQGRSRSWLLALFTVALVLLLVRELGTAPARPQSNAAPNTAAAAPSASSPSFTMPPLARYREVLERPLFVSSRRPAAADDGSSARSATELALVGIVISPTSRQALLQYGNPPKLVRVGEGQTIAGWTVEAIRPDDVLVRQGGRLARVAPKDLSPGNTDESASATVTTAPPSNPTGFGSLRRAIKREPHP